MKAGILESDRVLTVSPYYAQELVSGEDKGVELDNIIRKTGITGIVNGMDVQEWNPVTDKYISVNYDETTVSAFDNFQFLVCLWYLKTGFIISDNAGNGCKAIIKGNSSSRSWVAL